MDQGTFKQRTLAITSLVVLLALVWVLASVLLLAFAGVVLAVLLRGTARSVRKIAPVGDRWALVIAVVALVIAVGGVLALIGFRVSAEFDALARQLPNAWNDVRQRVAGLGPVGDLMRSAGNEIFAGGVWTRVAGYFTTTLGLFVDLVLICFGGLYFAIDPETYRKGVAVLFQESDRRYILRAFDRFGAALWQWLLGQFVEMTIVGLLTGVSLWLIGLPTAMALGIFAGFASFVPYVGPIVGIAPALLLGVAMSFETAFWVFGAYLFVQVVESYVVQPLVQERMVSLPPALLIFSITAFALLFGILGVLLATPLTVFAFVAVREFYLRDTLGEPIEAIGSGHRVKA